MNDYIEREDAILEIQKFGVGALDFEDYTPEQAERFVIGRLRVLPAADVAPVVRGRWIVTAEFTDCVYARCDQCKITQVFYHNKPLTNYCPSCGAKMDGGEDDASNND